MTLIWMADVLTPCKVLVTSFHLGRKSEDSLSTLLPKLIPGLRTSVSKKQPLLSFTHLLIAPKHCILRRVCSVLSVYSGEARRSYGSLTTKSGHKLDFEIVNSTLWHLRLAVTSICQCLLYPTSSSFLTTCFSFPLHFLLRKYLVSSIFLKS